MLARWRSSPAPPCPAKATGTAARRRPAARENRDDHIPSREPTDEIPQRQVGQQVKPEAAQRRRGEIASATSEGGDAFAARPRRNT